MALADWFRPPRSVLTLYLIGAGAALLCLTWLAVRQLSSEELVEAQRTRQRLAGVADVIAARVHHGLRELEESMAGEPTNLPAEAVVVVATNTSVRVERGSLPFLPVAPASPVVSRASLAEAESLEFVAGAPGRAANAYRAAATGTSAPVRAHALVGLARVLRRTGNHDAALNAYTQLATLADVRIEDRPADLIARVGRCRVLEQAGRRDELARDATALRADLAGGKWPITGAVWEAIFSETATWGADNATIDGLEHRLAIADAFASYWDRARDSHPTSPQLIEIPAGTALILARASNANVRVLIVDTNWLQDLWREIAIGADVDVALVDDRGRAIVGRAHEAAVSLPQANTGLPWSIAIADAHPEWADRAALTRLRTFLLGLGLVALVIVGSGVFAFRGMRRELAIARVHADFVSAVSHEFRTPLTSIRQLSHMLQSGRVENEGRRDQYYSVLARESERLHRLVERLLKFGRADAGRLRFEVIDAAELVAAVADDFRQSVGAHAITVAPPDIPCPVRADRDMLSLAVWNLLDNALKYSSAGSPVRLDVAGRDHRVHIAVRDEGIGIAPQEQRRIFEKFVRGGDTVGTETPGSGLGLALVERVVRAHGGEINLQSAPGGGSTFTLVLPLYQEARV